MNRRADDRIEMKLPCQLLFPKVWKAPVSGVTANFHRNGILVACDLSSIQREIPALGDRATVRIVLPANHAFSQKCIDCESFLVRTRQVDSGHWQFALQIEHMHFVDGKVESPHLMDLDGDSCRYIV